MTPDPFAALRNLPPLPRLEPITEKVLDVRAMASSPFPREVREGDEVMVYGGLKERRGVVTSRLHDAGPDPLDRCDDTVFVKYPSGEVVSVQAWQCRHAGGAK